MQVEYLGQTYEFPDSTSDADIAAALHSSTPAESTKPQPTPQALYGASQRAGAARNRFLLNSLPAAAATGATMLVPEMAPLPMVLARMLAAGGGGTGGELLRQPLAGEPMNIPGALQQGGVQSVAEMGGGLLSGAARSTGRGLVRSAFSVTPGMVEQFPTLVEDLAKARATVGSGPLGRGGLNPQLSRLGAAGRETRAAYSAAEQAGHMVDPHRIVPAATDLVDPASPHFNTEIVQAQKLVDDFLTSHPSPFVPPFGKRMKQQAWFSSPKALKNIEKGELAATPDQAMKARFDYLLGQNIKRETESFPAQAGDRIADAEAATQKQIGVKKAVRRAEKRRDAGLPARLPAAIPSAAGYFVPRLLRGAGLQSRLALLFNEPAFLAALANAPRALTPLIAAPPDVTQRQGGTR